MNMGLDRSYASATPSERQEREPLAIIGIGCRFPGGADSPAAFWQLLSSGVDAVIDIPADRWDNRRFYDPDTEKPGKAFIRQGGFLRERIDQFDASFFGILPREAARMDPQQRLLLEVTWEALEDAGLPVDRLAGSDTGVYVGGFMLDNQILQMNWLNRDIITGQAATGTTMVMMSNRISYIFDFRGPSFTLDTACSSSLVAFNYACQDLWHGRCSLAVVGGVSVMLRPEYPIAMTKGGFLAPDARCKTFDERANGYCRGEGAGVVIVKPASDALRDGDPIYALIRGTGVNQDGRTDGITMPSGPAQEQLIRRVYAEAGVRPAQLSYLEAHGTGTSIGDPTECKAFGAVLADERAADEPCLIGSTKANIGHLEAAAGVAGVIKASLCLRHGLVPPQLHIQKLNPKIPFEDLRLRVPQELLPMPRNGGPALVSINSFGYGGTNAHAVLQEAPETEPVAAVVEDDGKAQLLTLSARSPEALQALAQAHLDRLTADDGAARPALRDLSHALGVRRSHHTHRLALVAGSHDQAIGQLRAFVSGERAKGVTSGQIQRDRAVAPVFVFTGMGPQWWAMGRELLAAEPVFRQTAEEADAAFQRHAGWSILKEMMADQASSRMASNDVAQPGNFIVQVALAALLKSWGIEPAAIVGHSVGEVSAAHVCGALDLDSAARVSFHRSRVQQRAFGQGRMLAVGLPAETAVELLESFSDRVSIAAINSPSSVTLGGDPEALADISAVLEAEGVFNRALRVEIAYHSVQMEPLKADLLESLHGLEARAPVLPIWSTVTGGRVDGAVHGTPYWWQNVRQTVRFADAISRLADDGHTLFIEVGPHPVLGASIRECLRAKQAEGEILASLTREQPERAGMLETLGNLYRLGYPIDFKRLHPEGGRHVSLPRYPWQRELHWAESAASMMDRMGAGLHPLLGNPVSAPTPAWEADLNRNFVPWLDDHQVQGAVVFPGAGYIEAALAAQRLVSPAACGVLEDIEFRSALVLGEHERVILRVETAGDALAIHSRVAGEDGEWRQHAALRLSQDRPNGSAGTVDLAAIAGRCPAIEDVAGFYRQFDAAGLQYGPGFRIARRLWAGSGEVLADIAGNPELSFEDEHTQLHPTLLDAAFHTLIAALPGGIRTLYLPVRIDRIAVFARPAGTVWSHGRVTRQTATAVVGDITLCDADGRVLVEIRGLRCQAMAARAEPDSAAELKNAWYDYEWVRSDAAPAATGGGAGRWVIFADEGGAGAALAESLTGLGGACTRIHRGDAFEQTAPGVIRIVPDSAEELDRALAAAELQRCRGVAYFWGLDARAESGDPIGLEAAVPVLSLVRSLAQIKGMEKPRLFIATRGVHRIGEAAHEVAVAQSSLWGLGRVIMNEHPEVRCTVADLDADSPGLDLAPLVGEMMGDDKEEEIAFRGADRWVHRLHRVAMDTAEIAPVTVRTTTPFVAELGKTGAPEDVRFHEVERREPGAGEVELKIAAVALTPVDGLKLLGTLPETVTEDGFFGAAIGTEIVAKVVQTGEGVDGLKAGDDIVAIVGAGGLRSYLTLPADRLFWAPIPGTLAETDLAGQALAAMTALHGLRDVARLQPGEKLLVQGATGSLGLAALQVAALIGADILASAATPEQRDHLKSLGIEHVLDSTALDLADRVLAATGGRGVDVVLGSVEGEPLDKSLAVLAPYGRLVEAGKRGIAGNGALPLRAFQRNLSFAAVDLECLLAARPEEARRLFREVWEMIGAGRLRPVATTVFPVGELAAACQAVTGGATIGKVVVGVANQDVSVLPLRREAPLFRPDGTYMVTGGFGGLGLEIAKWMGGQGARHVVLVGRSGASTPEAQAVVRSLEEAGAQVYAAAVDIAQEAKVREMLDRIAATMPPLRGIMHGAMVLDDCMMAQVDRARFTRVMVPKAGGAWLLHQLTRDLPLDHFVLFSSVAMLLGNNGQASYCAANAYLDSLADHRLAQGLPAMAIDWGMLGEIGVAAQDETVGQHLARKGMTGLTTRQSLDALARLLREPRPQIGIMHLEWPLWYQATPAAKYWMRFTDLFNEEGSGANQLEELKKLLIEATPHDREAAMTALLVDEIAKVLRLSAAKLDTHEPLSRIGVDSLTIAELQVAIQGLFQVEISALELMRGVTIAQLAVQILEKMKIAELADAQAALVAPPAA